MSALPPISSSAFDLERRRLESTIDQDLSTLSLSSIGSVMDSAQNARRPYRSDERLIDIGDDIPSIPYRGLEADKTFLSGSSHSMGDDDTIEQARGFGESPKDRRDHDDWFTNPHPAEIDSYSHQGPSGTPRAAARRGIRDISGMSVPSMGESPVSTAGHHVSGVSLADGVFRRKSGAWSDDGSEFDPERSLGRLVGELGKAMGGSAGILPRPTSPFSTHHHSLSPPRSPSPLPSFTLKSQPHPKSRNQRHRHPSSHDPNLSYSLTRADPLPSPPHSGGSSGENHTTITNPYAASTFTAAARELQEDIYRDKGRRPTSNRRALSDSTAHNIESQRPGGGKTRRVSGLQSVQDKDGRRTHSAPTGRKGKDISADVTGMTGLMGTPAKGGQYEHLGKNGDVGGDTGSTIPQTLATLHARLRGLETENSIARRRVRELEGELERAKGEVEDAKRQGGDRLREAIGQKSALEDLVKSLRTHLTRLTSDLEESKHLVHTLQTSQPAATYPPSPPRPGTASELVALRKEIERLTREVGRLGGVVERGLETRRVARGEQARVDDTIDIDQPKYPSTTSKHPQNQAQRNHEPRLPSKLRQGLHASASTSPTLMPPSAEPPTRTQPPTFPRAPPTPPPEEEEGETIIRPSTAGSSTQPGTRKSSGRTSDRDRSRKERERQEGPESPFPSIRAEDEAEFFAQMEEHVRSRQPGGIPEDVLKFSRGEVPPQTVLTRVIRELEDDFAHYKAIYCELADQYKLLDAASAVAKRHVLADHLKEVIDTLEQKADHISSLYDLLNFSDKPDTRPATSRKVSKSVGDVMRMVRETLGEEGMERLKKEGVVPMGRKGRYGVV